MSDTLLEPEDQTGEHQVMWTHAALECGDETCPCHEWVRQKAAKEVSEHQPAARGDWRECDTCRAKPGSPVLCSGCLHNRTLYQSLVVERERLEMLLNNITTRAKFALSTPGFIRDRDGLQKAVDAIEQRSTPE